MRKLALRLTVASLTFMLGVAATAYWLLPRFRHPSTPPPPVAANSLQASEQPKAIRCPADLKPRQRDAESTVVKGKASPWKTRAGVVSGGEDLGVVQFLNPNEGWVGGSRGALYKTADAGQTWQKVRLDVPPDASVNSIQFLNPSVGWVVVSQAGNQFDDINTLTSRILRTSDGGKSWDVQYSGKAVRVDKVQFVNEREGWAVGAQLPVQVRFVGLVLRTTDGGKSWSDVAPKVGDDELGNTSYVTNIFATEPSKALILKFSRIFYSTDDGGRSWQRVASLPEEPPQAFLGEFKVVGRNRMWAVGGPDSIEGMWGTAARMDGDCSWTKYSIGGLRFSDVAVVSEKELIVSGAVIPADTSKGHYFDHRFRDGMLMSSSDGGSSWAIVYQDRRVRSINTLAAADAENVWAAGGNGYVIHLTPASEK